ncbi:MAG TPA: hypothetical protein VFH54_18430 [Mycobacteriales bacterium]|nr:hypothetical protein [Mycobacteriales bacterium]
MRRHRVALVIAALSVPLASGIAVAGVSGGDVPAACYSATQSAPDARAQLPCKFVQGTTNQAGAYCRIADDTDDNCAVADGRDISDGELAAYEKSWTARALSLQNNLETYAPFLEEQLPHTHNSFNSSAYDVPTDGSLPSYYPTLTNQDPNQVYSLTEQMDMGVRAIELDLHWVPSPYGSPATNGFWVTLCHGDGQQVPGQSDYVHVGCSDDRPAQDGFAEVRAWLDKHPDQFLLVYLENQLYPEEPVASQEQAHDIAASLLQQAFGSLVYKPQGVSPGNCATLPYTASERQLMATGARVLLVGNCGPGAWSQWVFQRGNVWDESGQPSSYSAADCARDEQLRESDTSFRREFEDSTFVSAATGSPTPAVTAAQVATMVRCGVNIIGLDQLQPQDGRLAALVWSWAQGEPATDGCAYFGADDRFHADTCFTRRPASCQLDANTWQLTRKSVPWSRAASECQKEYAAPFGVPMNGFRSAQLATVTGGQPAWLNYSGSGNNWTPGGSA